MKRDRGLVVILSLIVFLVVLALVLFFIRQDDQAYIAEDTPEGIVHNYVLALHQNDYQRAYGYIQEADYKPSYTQFQQTFFENTWGLENTSVQMDTTNATGDEAFVSVSLAHNASGPFEQPWYENGSFSLIKQAGQWKLAYAPSPYWGWDWYSK